MALQQKLWKVWRAGALGLPAHVRARIAKSLHNRDTKTSGSWDEVLRAGWDSAQVLCAKVASTRADFAGLDAGLSTSSYRQLKLDGQNQKEDRKVAYDAALGGVWHEERAHAAFRCGIFALAPCGGASRHRMSRCVDAQ
eukprot:2398538-Amphidinium_carterae.3